MSELKMETGNLINGLSLAWSVIAGLVIFQVNMYSDIQVLKNENLRMNTVMVEQASVKSDVKVIQTDVDTLKQNVVYLNTSLKESTDRMNSILIKLETTISKKEKGAN